MKTKLSFTFCFFLLIFGLTTKAQNSYTAYNLSSNVTKAALADVSASKSFVDNMINTYKFKKGLKIDDFEAYNKDVFPITRVGRNVYKKSFSRVYLKLFESPLPQGPGSIIVDKYGYVSSYSYIVSSTKDLATANSAYDDLVNQITRSVDPKFISSKVDGISVNIPESEAVINIRKIDAGQWHAVEIFFN